MVPGASGTAALPEKMRAADFGIGGGRDNSPFYAGSQDGGGSGGGYFGGGFGGGDGQTGAGGSGFFNTSAPGYVTGATNGGGNTTAIPAQAVTAGLVGATHGFGVAGIVSTSDGLVAGPGALRTTFA